MCIHIYSSSHVMSHQNLSIHVFPHNLMRICIHIHTYVYIYIYTYTYECIHMYSSSHVMSHQNLSKHVHVQNLSIRVYGPCPTKI